MKQSALVGASVLAATAALSAGCGGQTAATANPVAPAPVATPTPVPTPTPTPAAIACGKPTPAPLYTFRVKVQDDFGWRKVLDSRAMVGKDAAYCASIGYPGNICVVRNEDAPDAVTCGNLVAGLSSQTGRYGPNWYWNDQPCRPIGDPDNAAGCKQHPTNQFQVFAYGPGVYSACGDNDRVCYGITIDPN